MMIRLPAAFSLIIQALKRNKKDTEAVSTSRSAALVSLISEGHLDDEQKFKNALEGSLFLTCVPFDAALPSVVLAEENLKFKRRLKSRIYGRKDRLQRFSLLVEDVVYKHDEAWQA